MFFGLVLILLLIAEVVSGAIASFGVSSPFVVLWGPVFSKIVTALHYTGASLIFVFLYTHLLQKFFRKSYISSPIPWVFGIMLMILVLFVAAVGCVLKMDYNGYWGFIIVRHVVSNLPFVNINPRVLSQDINIKVIFWLHAILPICVFVFIIPHLSTSVRSLKPIFVNLKGKLRSISYKTMIMLCLPALLISPFMSETSVVVDSLFTPENVSPPWYIRPFYMVLLYIDDPVCALSIIVGMFAALFAMPLRRYFSRRSGLPFDILWVASSIIPSIFVFYKARYDLVKIVGILCISYYFIYLFIDVFKNVYYFFIKKIDKTIVKI